MKSELSKNFLLKFNYLFQHLVALFSGFIGSHNKKLHLCELMHSVDPSVGVAISS